MILRRLAKYIKYAICSGMLLVISTIPVVGQTESAALSGTISDQLGAVIQNATVYLTNVETGVTINTTSSSAGLYVFPNVHPGRYHVRVEKSGFKQTMLTDLTLNVQDTLSRNFQLQVGSTGESVTVNGDMISLNTQTATVSTVIDRQFVENMPLNGRTFQTLIELTPGVAVTTGSNFNGTFSVNGQRQDANSFTVDGVSANVGFTPSPGSAFTIGGSQPGGNLPNLTSLGTTQSLVSVDAMQEFRVQTSTYSAQYGRQPGGQVSIMTRSGTNSWHGTVSEYLRNTVFDANNWFANNTGRPRPPEQQNDFGGTFGGPLKIPHVYNGKDRTFFFFSYEGLRLRQPTFAFTNVPTVALRQAAPVSLQPILNAFPIPNCAAGASPASCSNNLGNGLGDFAASYSNPATLNATSLRLDHVFNDHWTGFGRYSYAPSSFASRIGANLAIISGSKSMTQTATLGLSGLLTSRLTNDFRVNYTSAPASQNVINDDFGGAVPAGVNAIVPAQFLRNSTQGVVSLIFPGATAGNASWDVVGGLTENEKQFNVVDTVAYQLGSHQFTFGTDWRRLEPFQQENQYLLQANFTNQQQILNGLAPTASLRAQNVANPVYLNFSAFAQDNWKLSQRLTLDLGLRWDVNPAPGAADGVIPPAVNQSKNFATMALDAPGTPNWKTTYNNFAPRLGVAFAVSQKPGHELVVRSGFGVFYDSGNNLGSAAFNSYPFNIIKSLTNLAFPINPTQVAPPPIPPLSNLTPPYGTLFLFDPDLKLPYTLEWSLALEQALSHNDTVSVSYVGNSGERLLQNQQYVISSINPNFTTINLTTNQSTSSYNALQAQYRRHLSQGLQALLSYTWSHSIDTASTDAASVFPPIKGNSAYDVPQLLAGALTYNLPSPGDNRWLDAMVGHWSASSNIHAQSGIPVNVIASQTLNPATGTFTIAFPNVVPGTPYYLNGSACTASNGGHPCPGGQRINPAAFKAPSAGQNGDLGRDVLRGLPSWQVDFALQREFGITEKLKLEFRAEAFNVLNHPNFGLPNVTLGALNFGQPTNTLNAALPGVNPLYQMGGPRSLQFALRLTF